MQKKIAIYLAGSIKKGHEPSKESHWTDHDMHELKQHLQGYDVAFLNPAFRFDDLSDQLSVFGRDMLQVFCSDVVFVDARDRRGLGVGAEMMWAKFHKIPIVVWAPKDSHYHKSSATILGVPVENFVHPFVEGLGDKIVETLAEGAQWIKTIECDPQASVKGVEHIENAMKHYKAQQFHRDRPMQEVVNGNEGLQHRVGHLRR